MASAGRDDGQERPEDFLLCVLAGRSVSQGWKENDETVVFILLMLFKNLTEGNYTTMLYHQRYYLPVYGVQALLCRLRSISNYHTMINFNFRLNLTTIGSDVSNQIQFYDSLVNNRNVGNTSMYEIPLIGSSNKFCAFFPIENEIRGEINPFIPSFVKHKPRIGFACEKLKELNFSLFDYA